MLGFGELFGRLVNQIRYYRLIENFNSVVLVVTLVGYTLIL